MVAVTVAYQSLGPGEVLLDSFPGADDDAKLRAAMVYSAAQTYSPTIRMLPRRYYFGRSIGQPYDGFALVGSGQGMALNVEKGDADHPNTTRVQMAVPARSGEPAGYWIEGASRIRDLTLARMLMYSNVSNRTQVIRANYGKGSGLYGANFYNLSMQGVYSWLGNSKESCALTLAHIHGENNLQVSADTMCNIAGSDNRGLFEGMTNIFMSDDYTPKADFKYCMMFSSCAKTSVGAMYITAAQSWRGLYVDNWADPDTASGLIITAPVLEGDGPGASPGPCDGALIRVEGTAGVTIRDAVIDAGLRSPAGSAAKNRTRVADRALVEINSTGRVLLDGCLFGHYGPPVTTPVVWASATSDVVIRNTGKYVYTGGTLWKGAKPVVRQDKTGVIKADDTVTVTGP